MKRRFYRWIFFRLLGWTIVGKMDPQIKRSVLMVLPHTSWHDFYIGLLARGIIGLEMNYVAKKELFRFPFGIYFRYMGGAPIDRSGRSNKVDLIARIFERREVFRIAISPEGTRKSVAILKTGFYFIAAAASVPIIPVAFDYRTRSVRIANAFSPSGDYESDLNQILQHFIGVSGKIPNQGFNAEAFLNSQKSSAQALPLRHI